MSCHKISNRHLCLFTVTTRSSFVLRSLPSSTTANEIYAVTFRICVFISLIPLFLILCARYLLSRSNSPLILLEQSGPCQINQLHQSIFKLEETVRQDRLGRSRFVLPMCALECVCFTLRVPGSLAGPLHHVRFNIAPLS